MLAVDFLETALGSLPMTFGLTVLGPPLCRFNHMAPAPIFFALFKAISPSRSSGRKLCPNADRSMTIASASSRMVGGLFDRRSSSDSMAYCVVRKPDGASASS